MKAVRSLATGACGLALAGAFTSAFAADWVAQRPVRVVVPYAAGGSADVTMRVLADKMAANLNQPVIVENRPGAGTAIGAQAVAKAAPDGYTLLFATSTTLSIAPLTQKQLGYTKRQFAPVGSVQSIPFMLITGKEVPAKNISDLLAYWSSKGTGVNFGTLGNGASNHILGEILSRSAKLPAVAVPYAGTAPALVALMRGDIDFYFDGIPTSLVRHVNGDVRGLAVTSKERVPAAPDVPTVYEQGHPELGLTVWYGLVAPAGIPEAVSVRLNQAINASLSDPSVASTLARDGAPALKLTTAEFGKLIDQDAAAWEAAISRFPLKAQ